VGDKDLYVVGGERLGKEFLASLVFPAGMRALLYLNLDPGFEPTNLLDASGSVIEADRFEPLIEKERQRPGEQIARMKWTIDAASSEIFHALPLVGRQKELLGVLLVGNSQHDVVMLERRIIWLAVGVVAIGLVIGMLMSWWAAARVTRPVQALVEGAREVTRGNWNARVEVRGRDEIAQLARAFNQMTGQLVEQRERLVQAERVAAWREVARRLAHELKNPLFPLQTTVENLQRAREHRPDQFEEVFRESTGILLAEIENLKAIVSRFSDFAKMPQPELALVNLNEVVRGIVKLFEAQFGAVGRPPITPELHLDENLPAIQADATLLHRALENLVLNAMDAMPAGGILMLRTAPANGGVHLEISDTGTGLTPEECDRLFTPYYTTKQHGTGLGLAIVQSVVSDHGGRIWVESESGVGTSFHIELPSHPPRQSPSYPMVFEKETQEA
jgi:nitrogen fixation/metabolism regulation signal transduction histidine kinase